LDGRQAGGLGRPRRARHLRRRVSRRIGATLLVLAGLWAAGFVWFAADIPERVADDETVTDAIVVLTGGAQRLPTGVALLRAGRARKLFVSGVYHGVDVAEILRLSRVAPGELECCVVLGYAADDTVGNARETAAWMGREGFRSLRLVTASYHLRRSLLLMRAAMPGATILPHPVFPPQFRQEDWWQWPGTASLMVSEYNKLLLALPYALLSGPQPGFARTGRAS